MQVLLGTDPPAISKLFEDLAGDLAFDIGANCGQSVARLTGYGHIVAVEPETGSFDFLSDKYKDDDRVTCIHAACSDHPGTVTLDVRDETIQTGQLTTGKPGRLPWGDRISTRDVPAVTCDQLMREYGIPDLLKVDTEGHEVYVLWGADRVLKTRPTVFLEIHSRQNGIDCDRILDRHGYQYVKKYTHKGYPPGSWGFRNHYWLVGR